MRVRDLGLTPVFIVCHFNSNSSFFIWEKKFVCENLLFPSPGLCRADEIMDVYMFWKMKSCTKVVYMAAVCMCACVRAPMCGHVCMVSVQSHPQQWHQHWLFPFRHFLDLTTILGETMAASSWLSPRAWKPMSWSKYLWWSFFFFFNITLFSQKFKSDYTRIISLQRWAVDSTICVVKKSLKLCLSIELE